MPTKILVLHGPNLNLLGIREPDVYGHKTLDEVNASIQTKANELGITVDCRQSNSEGELVTWIQQARGHAAAIIINAGAHPHTSIPLPAPLPAVEVPTHD